MLTGLFVQLIRNQNYATSRITSLPYLVRPLSTSFQTPDPKNQKPDSSYVTAQKASCSNEERTSDSTEMSNDDA